MTIKTYKNEFTGHGAEIIFDGKRIQLFVTAPHIKGRAELAINNTDEEAATLEAIRKSKNWTR